jgi:hypothetical protein
MVLVLVRFSFGVLTTLAGLATGLSSIDSEPQHHRQQKLRTLELSVDAWLFLRTDE